MTTYTITGTNADDNIDTYTYAGGTKYGIIVTPGLAMGYDS